MRSISFAFLILLTACQQTQQPGRPDNTLIRITESEARGLDPQIVSDLASIRIAADQFDGLTRFNGNGNAEPALAQSWTVSPDGLIWTFMLKPDAKFSDNVPIRSEVFPKALLRIRDEKLGSPHKALFEVIDSIAAADAQTVVIKLKQPFPQLPALLAHPSMAALPFHLIESKAADWTAVRPLVTSGPYRLIDWKLNSKMRLAANPYWNEGTPATPNLIWQPVDNRLSAMRIMLAGEADISTDFPDNRSNWLKQNYPDLMHGTGFLATYYFAFNTRRAPFNDLRVRNALSLAIDREWMATQMVAAGNEPAWGLLPPGMGSPSAYRPASASWTRSQRIAKASALLAASGYGPKRPLKFEIRFNSSAEHRRAAVALATMWRALGVETALLNSEASLHFDSLKRGDFAVARSGWVADLPAPENFLAVHRKAAGAQNYSGYDNPVYNRALDDALAEPNPVARARKMKQAETILMKDMPILPLYFYVSKALVAPDVTGWHDNNANVHPSYTLAKKRS
jgi:oligopeptide transport system substrate-binding protein